MPDVIYLDVAAGDDEVHQRIGSSTLADLLAGERPAFARVPRAGRAQFRVVTRKSPDPRAAAVQARHLRYVFSEATRILNPASPRPMPRLHAPIFLRWHANVFEQLASDSLRESFEVLLRNGDEHDVLVEVADPAPDMLDAAWRAIAEYAAEMLEVPAETGTGAATDYSHLPLEDASAARRRDLARDWPTAAEVSRQMGSTAGNASHLATRLRRDGQLLGVYMTVPTHHYRFPTWQFRPDGQPIPQLREILTILREKGPFLDSDRRTTGWGEVAWFMGGHALLDDRAPMDVLASDPDRVVAAARTEFEESP